MKYHSSCYLTLFSTVLDQQNSFSYVEINDDISCKSTFIHISLFILLKYSGTQMVITKLILTDINICQTNVLSCSIVWNPGID